MVTDVQKYKSTYKSVKSSRVGKIMKTQRKNKQDRTQIPHIEEQK